MRGCMLYELGVPPETATGAAQAVSPDAVAEVLKHIAWHHRSPVSYYEREHSNLRLYRAGKFSSADGVGAPTEGKSVAQAAHGSPATQGVDVGEVTKRGDRRSKKPQMIAAFKRLCAGAHLRAKKTIARNMTKKQIWIVVCAEIGVEAGVRGYGYAVFFKHVGSLIDDWAHQPSN